LFYRSLKEKSVTMIFSCEVEVGYGRKEQPHQRQQGEDNGNTYKPLQISEYHKGVKLAVGDMEEGLALLLSWCCVVEKKRTLAGDAPKVDTTEWWLGFTARLSAVFVIEAIQHATLAVRYRQIFIAWHRGEAAPRFDSATECRIRFT
jgi:hypothetical protein